MIRSPSVCVVILNHNGRDYLEACLSSVLAIRFSDCLQVVLFDNGSEDDSVEFVRARFPQVVIIQNEENLGFSRGINLAAQQGTGEYLALLNNDMHVNEGWLRALLEGIDPTAGIVCVGSVVMNWDGTAVDFAGRPDDAFAFAPRLRGSIPEGPVKALFVSGEAMLIDKTFLTR